jgi:uncharacterized protein YbgA (DUF1722 family)/uncharacterized protein YbbK (DUF523 family)
MMSIFPKPTVVISRCLEFDRCRYNGQVIPDTFVRSLKDFVDFQPVCPEVSIGLGIPRDPIRIVSEGDKKILYQPATGRDITSEMERFTKEYLNSLKEVDGFILKHGSPSCGLKNVKVYSGREQVTRTFKNSGFFGGKVLEVFPGFAIEDEGRLKNFTIREHFLTSIFALARFRKIRRGSIQQLIDFHTKNKLLLMAYSQTRMRAMGRIVANREGIDIGTLISRYEDELRNALNRPPPFTSMINVLQHALGGFSDDLSKEEKRFFLNSIEEYRDERIPLNTLLYILKTWSIRFNNQYLLSQIFMEPYPRELVSITDSGKGRDR